MFGEFYFDELANDFNWTVWINIFQYSTYRDCFESFHISVSVYLVLNIQSVFVVWYFHCCHPAVEKVEK